MPNARMITEDISSDERIWGLSNSARELFFCVIPHTDTAGSVPRNARALRLKCFPVANITDIQAEALIIEWLATKPPIVKEEKIKGNERLVLTDFERCNWDLEFLRKRREREDVRNVRTDQTVRNVRNVRNVPLNRRDVNGRE